MSAVTVADLIAELERRAADHEAPLRSRRHQRLVAGAPGGAPGEVIPAG